MKSEKSPCQRTILVSSALFALAVKFSQPYPRQTFISCLTCVFNFICLECHINGIIQYILLHLAVLSLDMFSVLLSIYPKITPFYCQIRSQYVNISYLSVHLLMDIQIIFSLWPLWIKLLWTFIDKLCVDMIFSFPLDKKPRREMARLYDNYMFNFTRNYSTVFQSGCRTNVEESQLFYIFVKIVSLFNFTYADIFFSVGSV